MAGPVKRSMMIAGHATSISLEPVFWEALREAAAEEGVPVNALVARIDVERLEGPGANLASAIRVWLFARARRASSRHPRESGDPVKPADRIESALDSRLRGNDE